MHRFFFIVFMLLPMAMVAQDPHTKCRKLSITRHEIMLDSLTVIPSSIEIREMPELSYIYDPSTGFFYFNKMSRDDSVTVCYQTIPYQLHKTWSRKDVVEYNEQKIYSSTRTKQEEKKVLDQREELFPTDNLQKSGSLSRGISFGNAQNVVVNSALNLQLEGKLGENLNIRASITDQEVPFQPEGNTAQIQDFDNIFIELYNDNFSLRGGDVVFRNKASQFLRYYKNVQGGMATARYKTGKKSPAETSLGVSVAKGKFASIQLEVEEGVPGPYRIRIPGANDFIIILANSEKVYLDGVLLQRGFNHDYVIDYNKAEIQFTSRVLITKFSRVRIDVEYSDRNYSRSIIAASHYQTVGKANFSFNYYQEKDNPNKPLTFSLNNDDKELLRSVGDDLERAVKMSAVEVSYNKEEVLYRQTDTLDADGNPVKIFIYTTDSATTLYRVTFSDVGEGRGNYILSRSTANGRVFQWVSPVGGASQGRYAPVIRIPAPNKKNMVTVGGGFDITKYEKVFTEVAFSNNDLNLYSEIDNEDNNGFAIKGGFESRDRPVKFMKGYKFSALANYEFDNEFFTPIDRFRYIEFDRDWSYKPGDKPDTSADHIFSIGAGLEKEAFNKISWRLVNRKRDAYVDGTQQYVDFSQSIGRFQIVSDGFFMKNATQDFRSKWNRVNASTFYKSRIFVPGYKFILDENELKPLDSDSITGTQMNYREHLFFINSNDTLKTKFGLSYSIREDKSPQGGELLRGDDSRTTRFFVNTSVNPNQKLNFLFTYRDNKNYLTGGTPINEETLIIRADWYAAFFKRHVRSDLTYATGSGRELRREFVFVQVPTGKGTHTWRDDNGDGIQDLSEFYIAINPDEKNYIKVWVPTSEYIFAYENTFNYRLNFELPRKWKKEAGFKKFLSKISGASSWNITKRITNPGLAARLLPFYNDIPEEDILSLKETIRSRIFFNRANPGFGMDFGYFRTSNKQLLTQGFDRRGTENYSANIRVNMSKTYNFKLLYLWGNVNSSSDFLSGRNYLISRQKIMPEISWQPGTNFRWTVRYGYSGKENLQGEPHETARIHEMSTNVRVSKAADFLLDAFFRFSNIEFDGQPNTPVAYAMLEALQPGQNFSWNLTLQKKILLGLQLSVSYEGRKSGDNEAVHIGRMQVSALF